MIGTLFALWRDKKHYVDLKILTVTIGRQKFYLKWTIEPFLLYGVMTLLILGYLGQLNALKDMPAFLKGIVPSIMSIEMIRESDFISGMLKGMLFGLVPMLLFGGIIGTLIEVNKKKGDAGILAKNEDTSGNLDSLIPRNYGERVWGAFLSLNAGFSEELFFRLLAPIIIFDVSGSSTVAVLGSTLWFGLAHYYQGISGVIITMVGGLLLFGVYVITERIWMAMLVHAIIDLNALVLNPWLREKFI